MQRVEVSSVTPEQLTDPGIKRSNEILRTCVHCGFCTATCPTYQVLGDELFKILHIWHQLGGSEPMGTEDFRAMLEVVTKKDWHWFFDDYVYAFELTSVLLVIAVIGAVVLARKPEKNDAEGSDA